MTHDVISLKYLVELRRPITYGIVQAGEDIPDGVPYIRPIDMSPSTGVLDVSLLKHTSREIAWSYRRSTIREGDLVVTIGPSYGKVMVVPNNLDGANLTQGTARVATASSDQTRFIFWALQSQLARDFWDVSTGGATFKALNLEPLSRTPIPLLPLNEQRRIADFLDAQVSLLDRAMALRQQQQALLEERRWSCFLEDVGDAQAVPLRRVVTFMTDGPFGSAFTSADYADNGAAVIRLGNIGFAEYRSQHQVFIPETLWRGFPRCHVRAGDLLVASLGDPKNHAGRACVAPNMGAALVKGKCFCVRVDESLAWCDYIALMLSSPTGANLLSVETRGATRGMINLDILRSVTIPLPPRQRQEEIARRTRVEWEHVKRLSDLMAQSEALLLERKRALITAAVTGQFDVTTARSVA